MRTIERHSSNKGSVITFDMYNKTIRLFVADARYRAFKKWGAIDINIPTMYKFPSESMHDMLDRETDVLTKDLTDIQLQNGFPSLKNDKTAKENTDILIDYSDTDAAHWCRSRYIHGVGQLDLPNLYELMVINLESDRLDKLDPSVKLYKYYALGKSNPYKNFDFSGYWSSTDHSLYSARSVNFYGYVGYREKLRDHEVIPVKELSIT